MVLASEITPTVELIGITKAYPGVVANSDIHLTLLQVKCIVFLEKTARESRL